MTLIMRRSDRRDRQLCRLGVMLVVASLVINMMQPPAKAVVIDATAAFGAAAATAAINGTTATTLFTGMGTSAATSSVIGLMDTYAVTTGVAASGTALASTIATGILVAGGTLLVGAAAAALIGGFIDWLREEKGLEAGGDPVVVAGIKTGDYLYNGVMLSSFPDFSFTGRTKYILIHSTEDTPFTCYALPDSVYMLESGTLSSTTKEMQHWAKYYIDTDTWKFTSIQGYVGASWVPVQYLTDDLIWCNFDIMDENGIIKIPCSPEPQPVYEDGTVVSLRPEPEFQEIPNEIPEGQILSIDTGLAALPQDDPQAAANVIMQSAIDGALAPTVSVEPDPSVQPDPDPEPDPGTNPDPDTVPDLPSNLGDLGNALTTRFPFSIPWDIAKAVKLLAAPAKAPYWEVDLFAPIAYRFGGLGDTTIYLDFGKPEFEIIGVTTRLTSTIGFCLALAAATKRFIWTA